MVGIFLGPVSVVTLTNFSILHLVYIPDIYT